MKVAVVGATGMVGQVMCQELENRKFPVSQFYPVASNRSKGKKVAYKGTPVEVIGLEELLQQKPKLALFSAGSTCSREWAPKLAEIGCKVIDNSSAWRMEPSIKLVVPEINSASLEKDDMIIANPNCSTIQLLMAAYPIHMKYHIERMVISTYQSVTGTGMKAVRQYNMEQAGKIPAESERAYPHPIYGNCIPHCDDFLGNGYTREEMKLVNESRKILNDSTLKITATAVRVPVQGGHCESINLELAHPFNIEDIKAILESTAGCIVLDQPEENLYPMPLTAHGKDDVFIGRLRRDESHMNALNMWVVADNLYKGAATNAIQIAEFLTQKNWL